MRSQELEDQAPLKYLDLEEDPEGTAAAPDQRYTLGWRNRLGMGIVLLVLITAALALVLGVRDEIRLLRSLFT
jgi:hypothetical protein